MNNEKLLFELGNIDPNIIDGCAPKKTSKGRIKVWYSAIAACLALVICAVPIVLRLTREDNPITDKYVFSVGEENIFDNVKFLEAGENYVILEINNTEGKEYPIILEGKSSETTPNGEITMKFYYNATPDASADILSGNVEPTQIVNFKLTVNGVETDSVPKEKGIYTVKIDYTEFAEAFMVSNIFYVGDELYYLSGHDIFVSEEN